MRNRAQPTLIQRLLFIALAPPCFVVGVVIGGCGFSARDDFLQVRSAQLLALPGDRSAFVADRDYPIVAGFAGGRGSLAAAPDPPD